MTEFARPLSADLFCGAGGLALGLEEAGFRCGLAVDSDPYARRTFQNYFGITPLDADVHSLHPDAMLEGTGLAPGDFALVCGGPPCQGFSLQRRGPRQDRRNDLVVHFFQLAVALAPPLILMENVPTLLGPRGKAQLQSALDTLTEHGYEWKHAVLNASHFGVPQVRRRAMLIAWDPCRVGPIEFPRGNRQATATVREAFRGLPEPPVDHTEHPLFSNHTRVKISKLNRLRISHVPPGGGRADLPLSLQLPCHCKGGDHRHLDVYGRLQWDEPAGTITARFDNFTRGRFAHPTQNRCITAREGARLQGFPDDFRFFGPKKDVARQIGNAVPPPLAKAIGVTLLKALIAENSESQMRLPMPTAPAESIA